MTRYELKPLHDYVLVLKDEPDSKTKGGIIIPNPDTNTCTGTVAEVGPGRVTESGELIKPSVSIWDDILFSSYAGSEYKIGDNVFFLIKDSDVLGIVTEVEEEEEFVPAEVVDEPRPPRIEKHCECGGPLYTPKNGRPFQCDTCGKVSCIVCSGQELEFVRQAPGIGGGTFNLYECPKCNAEYKTVVKE